MNQAIQKEPTKLTAKQNAQGDIINLIIEDHKQLKQLVKILKNSEKDIDARMEAFAEFAPALTNHSKSEEHSLYAAMKQVESLRSETLEGSVEHGLADQMMEEIKRTSDQDLWTAKAKVLAELVEHHIKEEEDDLLPDYRKNSDIEERLEIGQKFLKLKTAMAEQGNDDAPPEETISTRNQVKH